MSYICNNFTEEEIEKLYMKSADWHPSGAITVGSATLKD